MKLLTNRYTWMAALAVAGVVLLAPAAEARGPVVRVNTGFVSARPFTPRFNAGFNFVGRPFFPTGASSFGIGNGRAFPVVQDMISPFQPTFLQRSALNNWAFNTALIGRTYAQFPPWFFGYNPYPPAFVGSYLPYSPGYAPSYGMYNPYATGYGPYTPAFNPYNVYAAPYGLPPVPPVPPVPPIPGAASFNPYATP
jgi:hypothetical protein